MKCTFLEELDNLETNDLTGIKNYIDNTTQYLNSLIKIERVLFPQYSQLNTDALSNMLNAGICALSIFCKDSTITPWRLRQINELINLVSYQSRDGFDKRMLTNILSIMSLKYELDDNPSYTLGINSKTPQKELSKIKQELAYKQLAYLRFSQQYQQPIGGKKQRKLKQRQLQQKVSLNSATNIELQSTIKKKHQLQNLEILSSLVTELLECHCRRRNCSAFSPEVIALQTMQQLISAQYANHSNQQQRSATPTGKPLPPPKFSIEMLHLAKIVKHGFSLHRHPKPVRIFSKLLLSIFLSIPVFNYFITGTTIFNFKNTKRLYCNDQTRSEYRLSLLQTQLKLTFQRKKEPKEQQHVLHCNY